MASFISLLSFEILLCLPSPYVLFHPKTTLCAGLYCGVPQYSVVRKTVHSTMIMCA